MKRPVGIETVVLERHVLAAGQADLFVLAALASKLGVDFILIDSRPAETGRCGKHD
jgi:hypothetical protein